MTFPQAPAIRGYRVLRPLGSGGMSTVYEAVEEKLQRHVALKFLHPHLLKESVALERFKREALSASKIDHPNIIRIYNYFFEADFCCISMEFVDGLDMDSIIKERGPLPQMLAMYIMTQVAVALREAHDIGIMHRDIKPSNILLNRKNRVILTDFGLAFHFADTRLTIDNAVAGTPQFMSPEQISGGPLTFASDIYSWAVTCHFLLTARLPYPQGDFYALVSAVREGKTELDGRLRELPSKIQSLLAQCLSTDAGTRIKDGGEILKWMGRNADGETVDLSALLPPPDAQGPKETVPGEGISRTQILPGRGGGWVRGLVVAGFWILLILSAFWIFRKPSEPILEKPQIPPSADLAVVLPESPPSSADSGMKKNPVSRHIPKALPVETFQAASPAPDSGQFFVFSTPWADIQIDGVLRGRTPLESPISLPVGRHSIKLYNNNCEPRLDSVDILTRKIVRRRYQLTLKPSKVE